ncbi:MAG: BlaI/MecI/CopY family transcriptional regulator [Candidatus Heimdallarchaeota archaeon]
MAIKSELGPLELAIMQRMWKNQSSTVREIFTELKKQRKIAITTVSTTMNRLYEKGLLSREMKTGKGGIFYIYHVKTTKDGFEKKTSKTLADQLFRILGSSTTLRIIEELSKKYNEKELDKLLQELEKRKTNRKRRKKVG